MKIALVQPEYSYSKKTEKLTALTPPLSLLSLYKDADVYDLNIEKEPDYSKYAVVGVTAMSINYKRAFGIIKKAKGKGSITIMGGIHATSLPEETLKYCKELDIIVIGEGEETFAELVKAIEESGGILPGEEGLKNILGISYRIDGKIQQNQNRPLIKDLDIVETDYGKIDVKNYRVAPHHSFGAKYTEPYSAYMSSRGCPYECTFCASKIMWGRRIRFKSAEKIIREITYLVQEKGVKNIDFYDDTFAIHPKFIEIMDAIKKLDISFSCTSRVDLLTEKKIKNLKQSGCYAIRFGIETGNEEIAKKIKKGFNKEQAKKTLAVCRKYNLWANCCFIFGFPDENEKTAKDTIDFAIELDPELAFFYILMPLPKTEIEDEMRRDGLLFKDQYCEFVSTKTAIRTKYLSSKQLLKIRKNAYRRFYLRPRLFIKLILKIRTWSDIKNYFNGLKTILG
jgi:anaerobic magnesium-protoporphyrin IX monomethyl ester cyclase